jgi:hypothetical protein
VALKRLGLSDNAQHYSSLAGLVLSPGDDVAYLQPSELAQFTALRPHMGHRLKLALCYCSALDECWTTRNYGETLDDVQRPVDRCPVPGDDEFQN